MDTDDLPGEFDIVILGTGLTETIAAAAFSRIGLKVLHLDRNNYYGGSFANFNLQGIEEWKKKNEDLQSQPLDVHQVTDDVKHLAIDGKTVLGLRCERAQAHNITTTFHIRERTEEEKAVAEAAKVKKAAQFSPFNLADYTITSDDYPGGAKTINAQSFDTPCEIQSFPTQKRDEPETVPEEEGSESSSTATEDVDGAKGDSEEKESGESAEKKKKTTSKDWTQEAVNEEWRKFCFDLSPRVLYCSGELVDLLIQSDVARYCEFRTVSRVLTLLNGTLQQVPCSRADVFSSKIVSLIEKRLMMKFLQFAVNFESRPEEYADFKDKPFTDFLKSKKLSDNVQHFVQHAIAMVSDVELTEQGLKNTQVFLRSLGRYGNTAFLFSLYGSGELPQAFSRLSAVFGGVYCLMLSASHIIADEDNKCSGIITTQGKKITCKYVVAEASYLPPSFVQYPSERKTSRAIFITDQSICASEDQELSMLKFIGEDKPVTVMELPPSACVCPKGLFVVHLICEGGSDDPQKDFDEVKQKLFEEKEDEEKKPQIMWSTYFSQDNLSQASLAQGAVENVFVTSGGGDGCIDMEKSVAEARQIFETVCPGEEFLPKPPNPEDIIYVDDGEAAVASGPGEYESKRGYSECQEEHEESKDQATPQEESKDQATPQDDKQEEA